MIDLKVVNDDLVLGDKGQFETTTAISQRVYITFAVWQGDWFYDLSFGVDYPKLKQAISSKEEMDLKIKTILLSVPGVTSIIRFESEYRANTRFYAFEVVYKTLDSNWNELRYGHG